MIDRGLRNFKKIILKKYKIDLDKIKGSGAAGGISGGMYAIFNAKIISGFDYFERLFRLEKNIKNTDLVIAGEGMVDRTSFSGKGIGRIIRKCKMYNKPVILICGGYISDLNIKKFGVIRLYSIINMTKNKTRAMKEAKKFLQRIGAEIALNLYSKNQ